MDKGSKSYTFQFLFPLSSYIYIDIHYFRTISNLGEVKSNPSISEFSKLYNALVFRSPMIISI